MQEIVLSVSECIALINQTLDYAYPSVVIEGEISSFKVNRDKYVFFDIKDDTGTLNCFMMVFQLRSPVEDGMRVRLIAQPKLTAWGKFSLTVREIRPIGGGSIRRSFELLRKRLEAEGLFDESRKRRLPPMPEKIGLIASIESAGYADFIKIINGRWRGIEITVANVQVQGESAASQIMAAVEYFNQAADPIDVLVMIRGGGSAEDLSVFNEEPLVRAVAASRAPIIVGVGHETDISLCDLAADVRASTPSNAAQIVVPDRTTLLADIYRRVGQSYDRIEQELSGYKDKVAQLPERSTRLLQNKISQENQRLNTLISLVKQLDPKTTLRRGFAIIRDAKGKIIRGDVKIGESIVIELDKYIIGAGVDNVTKK